MTGKKLGIFVPVFRNVPTLAGVLKKIPQHVHATADLLVIDDGSPQVEQKRCLEITNSFSGNFLFHPTNRGVGFTTRHAFNWFAERGNYEHIVKFDGDGQHDPRLLEEVVGKLAEGNDIVIASRFHPNSDQTSVPPDRARLNQTFAGIVSSLTQWPISDARSGFMGLKFPFVSQMASQMKVDRYGIPMEILLRAWGINPQARIVSIPHPAVYAGDTLTPEHQERYKPGGESPEQKRQRFRDGLFALQLVLPDLGFDQAYIQEIEHYVLEQADAQVAVA